MVESPGGGTEGQDIVQQRISIFYKSRIVPPDPQLAQGHQHLCRAFQIGVALRIGITALGVLLAAHAGQSPIDGRSHRRLVPILRQGLERHTRDIRIGGIGGSAAVQGPAPFIQLLRKDIIDVHLPRSLGFCIRVLRHGIIRGIQGDERPYGAVDPQPDGLVIVPQGGQQVISPHIPRILPYGGEGDDDPFILRILSLVQDPLHRLDIPDQPAVVFLEVPTRHGIAAPG